MKNLKVLMVNKLYYPHIGGVEKHVQDLAESIKGEVKVKALVANTGFKTVVEEVNGVQVIKTASLGTLASAPLAPSLWLWLRRLRPDIYHFHFPYPIGDISYLLARPKGKLVVTYHSDIIRQKRLLALYRPFMNRFLKRADVIIAGSPNMVKNSPVLKRYSAKCKVVNYGINVERFKLTPELEKQAAFLRRRLGGRNIILFVGRLVYYKGVSYLVEAMQHIDGMLVLAGEGGLRSELEKKAAELGVADKIIFYGRAKDSELPALYHACDIFALPSVASTEAFGLVQLEAQACGKPVVSTNLPTGVPYANLDNVTGLIAEPKDSLALAKAVSRLLNEPELRLRLGAQGKKRVETEFMQSAMAAAVLKIYRELGGAGDRNVKGSQESRVSSQE